MVFIRIIKQGKNAEIFFDTESETKFSAFDNKRLVSQKLLHDFYLDWISFYWQSQELRRNNPLSKGIDEEIIVSLRKKANYLNSLLFKEDDQLLANAQKLVLFSVDAEFANLPFEILLVNDRYLYEVIPVIRQIRGKRKFTREKRKVDQNEQSLLILNPNESENLENFAQKEKEILKKFLDEKKMKFKTLKGRTIRSHLLLEELHNHQYIHFAGHTDKKGIPLFNGNYLPAEHISELNLSNVRLVFMNSCYSSSQNEEFDSLAQAFIKAGVENYIGFNLPVSNSLAHFTAEKFWYLFEKDVSIPSILSQIRNEIKTKFGEAELAATSLNGFGYSQSPESMESINPQVSEYQEKEAKPSAWDIFVSEIRNSKDSKPKKKKRGIWTYLLIALLLATYYLMQRTHQLQTEFVTPAVFYKKVIKPKYYKRSKDCEGAIKSFKKIYKTDDVNKKSWVDFEDILSDLVVHQCILTKRN